MISQSIILFKKRSPSESRNKTVNLGKQRLIFRGHLENQDSYHIKKNNEADTDGNIGKHEAIMKRRRTIMVSRVMKIAVTWLTR